MLAWRCTVHNFQSIALEKVVITFDLLKQRNYNHDHMYVAFYRVTSRNGLYLIGKFNLTTIKTDPRAMCEYKNIWKRNQLVSISVSSLSRDSLYLILVNTRSLNKHAIGIFKDNRLLQASIFCLTDTRITPGQITHVRTTFRSISVSA